MFRTNIKYFFMLIWVVFVFIGWVNLFSIKQVRAATYVNNASWSTLEYNFNLDRDTYLQNAPMRMTISVKDWHCVNHSTRTTIKSWIDDIFLTDGNYGETDGNNQVKNAILGDLTIENPPHIYDEAGYLLTYTASHDVNDSSHPYHYIQTKLDIDMHVLHPGQDDYVYNFADIYSYNNGFSIPYAIISLPTPHGPIQNLNNIEVTVENPNYSPPRFNTYANYECNGNDVSKVKLYWDKVSGAQQYYLTRDGEPVGQFWSNKAGLWNSQNDLFVQDFTGDFIKYNQQPWYEDNDLASCGSNCDHKYRVYAYLPVINYAKNNPTYNAPPGLIAQWHFNDGRAGHNVITATSSNGSCGNKCDGSLYNFDINSTTGIDSNPSEGWTASQAIYGQGLIFNGGNDYVTVRDNSALDVIAQKDEITIESVFKVNNWFTGWFNVIHKGDPLRGYAGYILEFNDSGHIYFSVGSNNADNVGCNYQIPLNTWIDLTVAYSRSQGKAKFFINGAKVCENPYSSDIPMNTGEPMYIGRSPVGNYEVANGIFDDVSIYDRALTDEEIVANFNNGPQEGVDHLEFNLQNVGWPSSENFSNKFRYPHYSIASREVEMDMSCPSSLPDVPVINNFDATTATVDCSNPGSPQVDLSWDGEVDTQDTYIIKTIFDPAYHREVLLTANPTDTTFTDTSVELNKVYQYQVQISKTDDTYIYSSTQEVAIKCTPADLNQFDVNVSCPSCGTRNVPVAFSWNNDDQTLPVKVEWSQTDVVGAMTDWEQVRNEQLSENYPVAYGTDFVTDYDILQIGARQMRVHFADINLTGPDDYIQVTDGTNIYATYDYTKTGPILTEPITGDFVRVKFFSGSDLNTTRGFRIDYFVWTDDPAWHSVDLTNTRIEEPNLSSPNYPGDYPENYDNSWEYTMPGAESISVHFSEFHVVCDEGDVLRLIDKNNNPIHQICGDYSDYTLSISGDVLKVRFISEHSEVSSGWLLDRITYNFQTATWNPDKAWILGKTIYFRARSCANEVCADNYSFASSGFDCVVPNDLAFRPSSLTITNSKESVPFGVLVACNDGSYFSDNYQTTDVFGQVTSWDLSGLNSCRNGVRLDTSNQKIIDDTFYGTHSQSVDIYSPNYPDNYDPNYDNTWTVTQPGATQIALHFDAFLTEITNDYLQILDSSDQEIARYSGDEFSNHSGPFDSIMVRGDTIKFRFVSDNAEEWNGWHIDEVKWSEGDESTMAQCTADMSAQIRDFDAIEEDYVLTSPNYPGNYPDNFDQTWIIKDDERSEYAIHFSNFITEDGIDAVEIYDFDNNLLTGASGDRGDFWIDRVHNNGIKVRFVTDGSVNYSGWRIDKIRYNGYGHLMKDEPVTFTPDEFNLNGTFNCDNYDLRLNSTGGDVALNWDSYSGAWGYVLVTQNEDGSGKTFEYVGDATIKHIMNSNVGAGRIYQIWAIADDWSVLRISKYLQLNQTCTISNPLQYTVDCSSADPNLKSLTLAFPNNGTDANRYYVLIDSSENGYVAANNSVMNYTHGGMSSGESHTYEVVPKNCTVPTEEEYDLSSPNYPQVYPNNYDNTWTITQPGATEIALHFSTINIEEGGDFIYILDGSDNVIETYSAPQYVYSGVTTPYVSGDTIKVRFTSNINVSDLDMGWKIDKMLYYSGPVTCDNRVPGYGPINATLSCMTLDKPTNLSSSAACPSCGVRSMPTTLNWDGAAGADAYKVEYAYRYRTELWGFDHTLRNYPDAYEDVDGESFEIEKPGAAGLQLHFVSFSLDTGDKLEIYDKYGRVSDAYDWLNVPAADGLSRIVEGDKITVKFTTVSGAKTKAGYYIDKMFAYSDVPMASDCVWYSWGAVITSNEYPDYYPNNDNIEEIISENGANSISAHFAYFDTEDTGDYVRLLDKDDNEIARYSGNLGEFTSAEVTGDTLKLRFVTNGNENSTHRGWFVDYANISTDRIISSSIPNLTFEPNISSPNYPSDYDDDYDNTWTFQDDGIRAWSPHFTAFNTEDDYDFVQYFDKDDQPFADHYSGNLGVHTTWRPIEGDTIKIRFITDSSITNTGWFLDKIYADGLSSPGWRDEIDYPDNYDNTWVTDNYFIEGVEQIAVIFWNFNTETTNDFVEIFDADDNLISTFSGNLGNIVSDRFDGHNFKLRFKTNESVTARGYYLDGVFGYKLTSIGYPGNYLDDLNKQYDIWYPNATDLKFHFSEFNTEETNDYLEFWYDAGYGRTAIARYSGDLGEFETDEIPRDGMKIDFVTNSSVNASGWRIDLVSYKKHFDNNLPQLYWQTAGYAKTNSYSFDHDLAQMYDAKVRYRVSSWKDGIMSEPESTEQIYNCSVPENIAIDPSVYILDPNDSRSFAIGMQCSGGENIGIDSNINNLTAAIDGCDVLINGSNLESSNTTNSCDTSLAADLPTFSFSNYRWWTPMSGSAPIHVNARYITSADASTMTDNLSNASIGAGARHIIKYNIGKNTIVSNGSLKIIFAPEFDMSSLASGDISLVGGDVGWQTATINTGQREVIIPFTGDLNKEDGTITINIGSTNLIGNPGNIGQFVVGLTSHNNNDGSGDYIDQVSDQVTIANGKINDTLSNSLTGNDSKHTVHFNSLSYNLVTNGSIKITFASEFDLSRVTAGDVVTIGGDVDWGTPVINATNKTVLIPFAGDLDFNDGMITITIGKDHFILNPENLGTYMLSLSTYNDQAGSGTPVDTYYAYVFLTHEVVVTATIPSELTFSLSGVETDVTVNSDATNILSTSSSVDFGELTANEPKIAATSLSVASNATNGYVVTIQTTRNLSSENFEIDNFIGTNGNPIAWNSPLGGIHGWWGYTTTDFTLSGGTMDRFGGGKWSGLSSASAEVMSFDGPTNGSFNGQGFAMVGYKIEINEFQASGYYSTEIVYVCTPSY